MTDTREDQPQAVRRCAPRSGKRCESYWPGHHMHFIHAKLIGQTPWGWRDGVVAQLASQWVEVEYTEEDGRVSLWHHRPVSAGLAAATLVRVHEEYHALGSRAGWLNVLVEGGLGPVPSPVDPAVWADEMTAGVVDLSTGRGLALDHVQSTDGP